MRTMLREVVRKWRPSLYKADMFDHALMRRYFRLSESARLRYNGDLRAILADRSLADDDVRKKWDAARKRQTARLEQADSIYREYQRRFVIPAFKKILSPKRRSAARN